MATVPAVALRHAFSHLGPRDRLVVAQVCRWWHSVATDLSAGTEPVPVRYDMTHPPAPPFSAYVCTAVYGADVYVYGHTDEFEGCECTDGCRDAKRCPCCRYGGHVECSYTCACSRALCRNRAVGLGLCVHLQLVHTACGLGVRTLEQLGRGQFVCEYAGEVLTASAARARLDAYDRDLMASKYLMAVRESFGPLRHGRAGRGLGRARTEVTYVDATYSGAVGRFINHSCAPNLETRTVRVGHAVPHVGLFVCVASIRAGEQLSFDYGEAAADITGVQKVASSGTPCLCGVPACRGFLPNHDELLLAD